MTSPNDPTPIDRAASASRPRRRGRLSALVVGLLLVASLAGCGCRPGYVGPYGGVHPGRCWIG